MGSPQPRTAFGGMTCNPYNRERSPGVSSAGAGASVSASLVTGTIGEETGISIHGTHIREVRPCPTLMTCGASGGPHLGAHPWHPLCYAALR